MSMLIEQIQQSNSYLKNKKAFLPLIILACLFLTSFNVNVINAAQSEENIVNVGFVYITKDENGGVDFETVSAVNAGNFILPYAAIQFTFEHPLTAQEQSIWESSLRIHNNSDGQDLRHLHEITADMPVEGRHASFYWRSDTELYYTPEGLPAGKSFSIILPEGWQINNGWETFQTLALTGTAQRFYAVYITDEALWEEMTSTQPAEERIPFGPCLFQDVTEGRFYSNVEMRVRGYASALAKKKNYTFKFDVGYPFTGFQDSSGVYQGDRRSIVAWGSGDDPKFLTNRVGLATLRKLEKRILGIPLSPDGYSAFLAINGRFYGGMDILEHPQTGKNSWAATKEKEAFGFLRHCFFHKIHKTGKYYRLFDQVLVPENEYDYSIGVGDGYQTHFAGTIPYPIYIQKPYEPFYPLDLKFEVEADSQSANEQMDLIAVVEEDMPFPYDYFDIVDKETGQWAGYLNKTKIDGYVDVTFPEAVGEDEKVNAEFLSLEDYDRFYESVESDENKIFDWMEEDSALIHIFYCRFTMAKDNVRHNQYHVMPKADNFETFRNVDGNPLSKYLILNWDTGHAYERPLQEVYPVVGGFPLFWTHAENSLESQERYIELFWHETLPGGILTPEFTDGVMNQLLAGWGNSLELEPIRWGTELHIESITNFINTQLGDENFIHNYVLSLNKYNYLPPPIDGSMELLTPIVKPGEKLKFNVTFINLTDKIQNFHYTTFLKRGNFEDKIILPDFMELAPQQTKVVEMNHPIPSNMPPGDYDYVGYVGDPEIISAWDTDQFTFTVIPSR